MSTLPCSLRLDPCCLGGNGYLYNSGFLDSRIDSGLAGIVPFDRRSGAQNIGRMDQGKDKDQRTSQQYFMYRSDMSCNSAKGRS